ncbi:MAG: hypothetical protein AAGG01_11505, partial [Planctomycetota bacterium]
LGRTLGFEASAGDELVFAGAHLHRTLPQTSGQTRFSLDFRVIDLEDTRSGRGAPLVDARCRGSAAGDYLPVRSTDSGNSLGTAPPDSYDRARVPTPSPRQCRPRRDAAPGAARGLPGSGPLGPPL